MNTTTEIRGNAITEREIELWGAICITAFHDGMDRGLPTRAARRNARMNANAEIARLRLHPDTAIEGLDHADAIVAALATAWDAQADGGPEFCDVRMGRLLEAARNIVLAADPGAAEARAVADYVALVAEQRANLIRLGVVGC